MENHHQIEGGNSEKISEWGNIPQDILGVIMSKFVYAADIIRSRAVCKNWYIPKGMITTYEDDRHLPWQCNFSWAENDSDYLECEVYDPYSRLIFQTRILLEHPRHEKRDNYGNKVFGYGSKQGWLIAAYKESGTGKWVFFLYNPCTNTVITAPEHISYQQPPRFAMFTGNPVSRDFQFYAFSHYDYRIMAGYNWDEYCQRLVLNDYRFNSGWRPGACRGMQYIDDHLFCLFRNGVMRRVSFTYASLDSGNTRRKLATDYYNDQLWLAKGDGDLLVAVKKDFAGKNCSTFCFDWSNSSWVEKDLPEDSAIFISGDVATFVRPFVPKNNKPCCNVYFFDEIICQKEPSEEYDHI